MFENPAWLFAIATMIACGGIAIVFKQLMARIVHIVEGEKDSHTLQRDTTNFFIKVAIIEVIPIILLIFGFIKMNEYNGTINDMIVPLIVTLAVYIFCLLVVFLSAKQVQNHPNITEMLRNQSSVFMMMGIAISSTFPLIVFVMIYLSAN